ncbi:MAG TPA: hypothetical protein VN855_00260 [Candidatus Acidoferrum sp.]|nr:hypothetical protein [Candidatus Acidoferrum sp.]
MGDLFNITAVMGIAAAITGLGGAWLTIRKVFKDLEKQRSHRDAAILQEAKEADALLKSRLENKIHELESQLKVFKEGNDKDLAHLKETYSSEIKFLGQKIEELRSEVRNQHSQLVQLLSKMLDKHD